MSMRFDPVQVATNSDDHEGQLAYNDERLVAVLVRLSDRHGREAGKWFIEAGFGRLADPNAPLFSDLGEVEVWIEERIDGS